MSAEAVQINLTVLTGQVGKSAYQSYLQQTEDDPVLTEVEWSAPAVGNSKKLHAYPPKVTDLGQVLANDLAVDPGIVISSVLDMQKLIPLWPYKYAAYGSCDHDHSYSGLRLYVSDSLTGGWLPWVDTGVQSAFTGAGFSLPASINSGAMQVTGFTGSTDKGEFPSVVWFKGKFYAYLHSSAMSSTMLQTMWLANSDDGLNWVYSTPIVINSHDDVTPTYQHNGYGAAVVRGNTIEMRALMHDSGPGIYTLYKSRDGVNFGHDPTYDDYGFGACVDGVSDQKMENTGVTINFQGRDWVVLSTKDRNGGGLSTGNSGIGLGLVNKRVLDGIPYIIKSPEIGTFTEDGAPFSRAFLEDLENNKVYVFYTGRSAADVNNIGLLEIDLSDVSYDLEPVWETAAGYEAFSAWYAGGGRKSRAYGKRRLALSESFEGAIGSGITQVTNSNTITAYDLIDGGGAELVAGTATCGLHWQAANMDFSKIDEAHITIRGLHGSAIDGASHLWAMGFINATSGATRDAIWLPRHTNPHASEGLSFKNDLAVDVRSAIESFPWIASSEGRWRIPSDFTVSVQRLKNPQDSAYTWYLSLWLNGEIIHVTTMEGFDAPEMYPYINSNNINSIVQGMELEVVVRQ
ncbi:hypothetical protein [Rubritalea sp.]|uniref:hypothetical protein n=1 Tax=Rubritalea sp. TaxID=2109375 RepID=UPI003EF2B092